MKPYRVKAHGLAEFLPHAVRQQARRVRAGSILSFASLVAPMASHADPEALAKAKHCFACHKLDGTRVGPSFVHVAHRYARDAEAKTRIIRQIREGSVGRPDELALPPQPIVATLSHFATGGDWREAAMPPQPQVNPEEAAQLADWILSLGK